MGVKVWHGAPSGHGVYYQHADGSFSAEIHQEGLGLQAKGSQDGGALVFDFDNHCLTKSKRDFSRRYLNKCFNEFLVGAS